MASYWMSLPMRSAICFPCTPTSSSEKLPGVRPRLWCPVEWRLLQSCDPWKRAGEV